MQNVSISLLSGNIYYGISNDTATNLQIVNSTCSSTFTVYSYDPARLLLTYGVALGVTAAIGVYGSWLVSRNGKEGKLLFSHIVQIAQNDALSRISGRLNEGTQVRLDRGLSDESWNLIPTQPNLNDPCDSIANSLSSRFEFSGEFAMPIFVTLLTSLYHSCKAEIV